MEWGYGVTTVPSRLHDLLPRTLISLDKAGFDEPRLFIDGGCEIPENLRAYPTTHHQTPVRAYGNWWLGLIELVIRHPMADRYAIFQDDLVTCPNLRRYLEKCKYPDKGYLNLYTFPSQEKRAPEEGGWYESTQHGKGAVGLVFNRDAVRSLLANQHTVDRPFCLKRGHKSIDGGVVTAMNNVGWKEYVHYPSLLQHTGEVSAIGNNPQPQATSFRGEDYDALQLLPARVG